MSRAGRSFDYGSAWLFLVVGIMALESYWFGFSAKACGGFGWGVYGLVLSPFFIVYKPLIALVLVALFVGGGFFYRAREPHWRQIAILAALIVAAGILAFMLTPVSKDPCSAL